jgi:type II secretory pathway component PulK
MTSDRRGFALLSVLWLVGALATLTVVGVAPAMRAQRASENRIQATRARWAARACLELTRTRGIAFTTTAAADSVALGDVVWCRLVSLRPDERVNPNVTDSAGLVRLLRDPLRASALLDWIDADTVTRDGGAEAPWYRARKRSLPRNAPLSDPLEIALVRGFEAYSATDLEAVFTTRGDGSISPNRAPGWALRSLSGLPVGLADGLLRIRGRPPVPESAEQVVAVLGLEVSIPEFRRMVERLSFAEGRTVVRSTGYVNAGRVVVESEIVATLEEARQGVRVTRMELR